MSQPRWSWVYWAIDHHGQTYVGAYETDGSNRHGDVPSLGAEFTLISESQMRSLAIEQRERVRNARLQIEES